MQATAGLTDAEDGVFVANDRETLASFRAEAKLDVEGLPMTLAPVACPMPKSA